MCICLVFTGIFVKVIIRIRNFSFFFQFDLNVWQKCFEEIHELSTICEKFTNSIKYYLIVFMYCVCMRARVNCKRMLPKLLTVVLPRGRRSESVSESLEVWLYRNSPGSILKLSQLLTSATLGRPLLFTKKNIQRLSLILLHKNYIVGV